ncbi:MAG: hypothetical protein K0M47_17840, partial [Rhizobium sp.]|nr:hypothetical protein [Rhizobium sp.]
MALVKGLWETQGHTGLEMVSKAEVGKYVKSDRYVGEIVSFVATPIWAGRRSLTVEVEMLAEAISTGERHL